MGLYFLFFQHRPDYTLQRAGKCRNETIHGIYVRGCGQCDTWFHPFHDGIRWLLVEPESLIRQVRPGELILAGMDFLFIKERFVDGPT